jgi:hypothetical protein
MHHPTRTRLRPADRIEAGRFEHERRQAVAALRLMLLAVGPKDGLAEVMELKMIQLDA